jgi:hypothetical protein
VGVVEWWRRTNVGRDCAVTRDGGGGQDVGRWCGGLHGGGVCGSGSLIWLGPDLGASAQHGGGD